MATKLYQRETFMALLRDDESVLTGWWFKLTDDGVQWVPPSPCDLIDATPDEVAIRNSGAMGARDGFALPFPFTFEQFVAFEAVCYGLMEEWITNMGDCRESAIAVLAQQSVDAVELVRAIAGKHRPDAQGNARPQQAQPTQEMAILVELRTLGYTAAALPKATKRGGAKAAAWKSLKGSSKSLFGSEKVFDLAWARLRKDGRIADAPLLPPST